MADAMREAYDQWLDQNARDNGLQGVRDNEPLRSRAFRIWQAALAQQPAQGEAVDKGLWRAESEHSNPVTGVWVASDDFEHDVRLYVNGDFESQEQRIAYAKRIAEQLNAPPAPSVSVPDGWRWESKRLIPLLQSFADRLANNSKSGAHHPELYEADHGTLMEAIRHLKQTAAPFASGGKASVPGWKWVPVEPTPEMLRHTHAGAASYRALLAAAPEVKP